MPIKLINKKEKFTIVLEGCSFFYRRLPMDEAERMRELHTKRGDLDSAAFYKDVFGYCLLGWEGVQDEKGKIAPFSHDAALELPDPVIKALLKTMGGTLGGEEALDGPDPF